MTDIKVEKTIYELLQEVRLELSNTKLEKTGYNKHLNFKYFELGDFVPTATKLFTEKGLCPIFNIVYDSNGIEIAVLKIVKGSETIQFSTPTDTPSNMSGIQALGAKITYLRRYLYLIALDIVENDVVDASITENKPSVEEKKATDKQVEMIKGLYDDENIAKILEYYNIEKLEDLNLKDASTVIAKKKGK